MIPAILYLSHGFREWRERDSLAEEYDDCETILHMKKNPNLSEYLHINIDGHYSTVRLQPSSSSKSAAELRREQTHKLAMEHVMRGAKLTREAKCFEAIQLFNKALSVDDGCVDAYVGRGAA